MESIIFFFSLCLSSLCGLITITKVQDEVWVPSFLRSKPRILKHKSTPLGLLRLPLDSNPRSRHGVSVRPMDVLLFEIRGTMFKRVEPKKEVSP